MDTFFIFGAKYLYLLPILILIWKIYSSENKTRVLIFTFSSLALTLILGKLSSLFINNPRPFVVGNFRPLIEHAPDNGFPSDHMLLVAAIAAIVTYLDRRLGLLLWLLAIIVGLSRIFVGVHHLLDILGSILIALISTYTIYSLFRHK